MELLALHVDSPTTQKSHSYSFYVLGSTLEELGHEMSLLCSIATSKVAVFDEYSTPAQLAERATEAYDDGTVVRYAGSFQPEDRDECYRLDRLDGADGRPFYKLSLRGKTLRFSKIEQLPRDERAIFDMIAPPHEPMLNGETRYLVHTLDDSAVYKVPMHW